MARRFTRLITTPAAARSARGQYRPFVSLLTDFGSRDPSAGILHGIVLGIAPEALIVDISHDVDKFQISDGALLLWCALPFLPIGSHVAVVDPGVGTERRGVALETARGDHLVGPDNGLLLPCASRLGGVVRAHGLENPQYRLPQVSASFHGRDLFAPAAAHLALGVPLESLGPPIDPFELVSLEWPEPELGPAELTASVLYIDTYGNVKLGALGGELDEALGPIQHGTALQLRSVERPRARPIGVSWARTFGTVPVGEPLLYEDSYGRLCIAVNQGSAAQELKLTVGARFVIRRPSPPSRGTGQAAVTSDVTQADVTQADVTQADATQAAATQAASTPDADAAPGPAPGAAVR